MSTDLIFIDTETTGLDPARHKVWEIAYARVEGAVMCSQVDPYETWTHEDPLALSLNRYHSRRRPRYDMGFESDLPAFESDLPAAFEGELIKALQGNTLVAANPAFDAAFLKARWGYAPWHYRMLDIESFAMPILGFDRPQGMATIVRTLTKRGYKVPIPDHTAAADVAALRASYFALLEVQA